MNLAIRQEAMLDITPIIVPKAADELAAILRERIINAAGRHRGGRLTLQAKDGP